MSEKPFRTSYRRVKFSTVKLSVHESAKAAREVWFAAIDHGRPYHPDCLVKEAALVDAIQCSPLPVIKGDKIENLQHYHVLGRFHILDQLRAFAAIEHFKRLKVTLALLRPPKGDDWDEARFESLAQALLILDNCGRGRPIDVLKQVYDETWRKGWRSLIEPRPTCALMAKSVGCLESQLRRR